MEFGDLVWSLGSLTDYDNEAHKNTLHSDRGSHVAPIDPKHD